MLKVEFFPYKCFFAVKKKPIARWDYMLINPKKALIALEDAVKPLKEVLKK